MSSERDELSRAVDAAFSGVGVPETVVSHECEECVGVRATFLGRHWSTISTADIARHYDSLPLLTPDAYRCYLAAYLKYGIREPAGAVAEFLVYSLDPEHQDRFDKGGFTREQAAVVLRVAEYIAALVGDLELEIARIRRRWSDGAG
jgi:hypothetical protein